MGSSVATVTEPFWKDFFEMVDGCGLGCLRRGLLEVVRGTRQPSVGCGGEAKADGAAKADSAMGILPPFRGAGSSIGETASIG